MRRIRTGVRVDTHHHDKTFIATFLAILGFLGAFTFAILFIANILDPGPPEELVKARVEERIKPVGQVITDPAALLKVSAASATARAPMSGADVVAKVCGACHGTGVLNAPKIGDKAAWSKLKAADGVAGLAASVVKGKNAMPPRGGDPSLSDAEIKAAIEQMLKQTGV
jgi:cytochrome c5